MPYVGDQIARRAAGTGLDVGLPLLQATEVLVAQLTLGGTLEPPHHAVRVAGDVGEHVTHAPAGQLARPASIFVGQLGQRRRRVRPAPPGSR